MNDFEQKLRTALSDDDQRFIEENINEKGYYQEVFSSLKGPGSAMNILGWAGVFIASGFLIFFLISAFHAETTREQILFASLAVMLNSAQIAFKIWLNMRMNRRAIQIEIQKLKLAITRQAV